MATPQARLNGRFTTDLSAAAAVLGDVDARKATMRVDRVRFTLARKQVFLETLAATLSISDSVKAAEVSTTTAHNHRKRDAAFRRAWGEATEEGYVRLEAVLLDRALNGKLTVIERGGVSVEQRDWSDALGLGLLAHHRRAVAEFRAAQGPPSEDVDVLRARLIAKINAMMAPIVVEAPVASANDAPVAGGNEAA